MPKLTWLVLVCADCGYMAHTMEDAEKHEIERSTEDEPHGGWDTNRINVG